MRKFNKTYLKRVTDGKKRRALKAMRLSDSHDEDRIGFLLAIFERDVALDREKFRDRMMKPQCYWIFSDSMTRKRMREHFYDEDFLNEQGIWRKE